MFAQKAQERIKRTSMESETIRSGTERGAIDSKNSKAKPTKPKVQTKSKVVKQKS